MKKIIFIQVLASLFAVLTLHGGEVKYCVYSLDQSYLVLEAKNDSEELVYASTGVFKRTYPARLDISFRNSSTKEAIVAFGKDVRASLDAISASLNVNLDDRLLEIAPGTRILRSLDKKRLVALGLGSLRAFYKDSSALWDSLEAKVASGEVEFSFSFPVNHEKDKSSSSVHTQWVSMNSAIARD